MVSVLQNFETLKTNSGFRRIYAKGKCFGNSSLVTYVLKNSCSISRIGITTSKKVGNAVKRNRSRRVIRAAFNELSGRVKVGYDFVFVARALTPYLKSHEVKAAMEKQLKAAGVLLSEPKQQVIQSDKGET
jgi:ribonuclease P protein component